MQALTLTLNFLAFFQAWGWPPSHSSPPYFLALRVCVSSFQPLITSCFCAAQLSGHHQAPTLLGSQRGTAVQGWGGAPCGMGVPGCGWGSRLWTL